MPKPEAIITIDGPSGSGKSTISKMLSEMIGYTYLDTGAMYRAVGLKIQRAALPIGDARSLKNLLSSTDIRVESGDDEYGRVFLDGEEVTDIIRTPEMGLVASEVSAHPYVREKLTLMQRNIAAGGGVVAEGRDMGTVVFPDAEFKFYLDASPEIRAQRRWSQLEEKGQETDLDDILAQIIKRDTDDSSREHAPLKPADDAVVIDSSKMNAREVVAFIVGHMSGPVNQDINKTAIEPGGGMAYRARILKRRHLVYYLEVHDADNGELLGHLVDITTRGMMLVSKEPVELDKSFQMQMMLPEGYFKEKMVRFDAVSCWSNNDVNPDFWDTGFKVQPLEMRARQIIMKLVNLIGFND